MSSEVTRVLVVDDELGMREGCRRILVREGYEVETAEDGIVALEVFDRFRDFAAVLVDMKMPKVGGLELIQELRDRDDDVVLLMITAYATINTAVEATKRGAYGYIPKPFSPEELLVRVRNGLERRSLKIEARRLREERERRLLEVAVERSKCSTIIDCMTDGVLVVHRDHQVVLRNAEARRLFPQAGSQPLPAELATLRRDEVQTLIEETLEANGRRISTREISLEAGTYMVNASPVLDGSGETNGAVAVFRDITALKKLSHAKSMFASMVAHEVKSPLAAIESYLGILFDDVLEPDPERDRRMIGRCLIRARTLRTMVTELISLVAVETGNFTLKRSPLDMCTVVAEVNNQWQDRAREKNVELCLVFSSDDFDGWEVLADRDALRSILSNLIDNAIKYTPPGGRVATTISHDGLYVKLAVCDTGIGMNKEERERVFEEFYRVKNDDTVDIPGTGLGLSLVKRLVELHQGTVKVRSERGRGSEFTVHLPLGD